MQCFFTWLFPFLLPWADLALGKQSPEDLILKHKRAIRNKKDKYLVIINFSKYIMIELCLQVETTSVCDQILRGEGGLQRKLQSGVGVEGLILICLMGKGGRSFEIETQYISM